MSRIAFIGLGRMGLPMATLLMAAGHELLVCDTAPEPVAALSALGARRGQGPGSSAATAEATITMLPTPEIVEGVLLGDGGVLGGAQAGSLVLEMSTSSPALARRLGAIGAERGIDVLDAPVSGGPKGAREGSLAIMVGGDEPAYRRAQPLLEVMGGVVRHMGGHGAGQATKLTNNLLAGAHMAVLAEAVALVRREGLDPATVYEVLSNGTGDSRVLHNRFPVPGVLAHAPASHDWEALFPVDLLAKDMELAVAAAAEHGLDMPLASAALDRYRLAQRAGMGQLDYSAVARLFEQDEARLGG
jgi:3-hydroxyisobutyrate dehydrogenase